MRTLIILLCFTVLIAIVALATFLQRKESDKR
jgi:hypothetical protein